MSARRALVTGASGQDGSYLVELLVDRGYAVTAMVRDPDRVPNLRQVVDRIELVTGDLGDRAGLRAVVEQTAPHELYHLAAPTFVPTSWDDPAQVVDEIAAATATVLAAALALAQPPRVFVASSSEVFGAADVSPQDETTPMRARTPYGVAKLAAHGLVGAQRSRGLFAVSGITYNHESPRRPEHFVTRKITRGAAAIAVGRQEELVLGDLDAIRDWSHAADVVRGAWLALQADTPDDYVFASGRGRTVRELVDVAFAAAGIDPAGHVRVDPALVRPPEPAPLVGNPARAAQRLGWEPAISFEAMIEDMVAADLAQLGWAAA